MTPGAQKLEGNEDTGNRESKQRGGGGRGMRCVWIIWEEKQPNTVRLFHSLPTEVYGSRCCE